MILLATIPDSAVQAAVGAAFAAMGLAIRTLYADSKKDALAMASERREMLAAMSALSASVQQLAHRCPFGEGQATP